MKTRRLIALAMGHMASDLYPGMLSPLLPLILCRYDLSMAMAGVLIMVLQFSCNMSQPVFAFINDSRPVKSLLWIGLLVSALPFAVLFKLNRIELMIAALAVSGIGVGMFHPVAVVAAGKNARDNRNGISMAIFSSGGSFGFMIAPLVVVIIVEHLGLCFMPLVLIPALVMSVLFIIDSEIAVNKRREATIGEWLSTLGEAKRELFILYLVATFCAIVSMNIGAFLPILAIARGASYVTSAYFLSGTLFASMIGMFIGGHLSDIHGRRRVMGITLLVSAPLLFIFLHTDGVVSIVALMLGMAALTSTIPVNIYLAQTVAPKHASIASSIVMGLPYAVAAIVAPPFGALADRVGIESAMNVMIAIPVLGAISCMFLRHE